MNVIEAKTFDGVALPNAVNAEGDAVRPAGSLSGVSYIMLVNADGSLQYGTTTTPFIVDLGSNNDVTVTGIVTANAGTNLNTSLLALEAGGNLAGATTSLAIMDDWDNTASDGASVSGDVAHDGVDAGEPVKIGFKAVDPTALPTSVAANDRANGLSDLKGSQLVYLSSQLFGEDSTNTLIAVIEKPLSVSTYTPDLDTSAALEASSVTKASAGNLYGFSASNTNATGHWIQFFNSTTVPADATVPALEFAIGGEGTISQEWPKGRHFSTGISWCISSTNGTKTIAGATALADVNFK